MKNLKIQLALYLTIGLFMACSNDDNSIQPVSEEEVITTLIVSLQPENGGGAVLLEYRDTDGDGPNVPVTTVSGNLSANVVYNGTIQLLNETLDPAEDITLEILEEAETHQFFYTVSDGIQISTEYTDTDANGKPIGVQFKLTTGEASSGSLTVTLRHEPDKEAAGVADGNITNAGGETDISAGFELEIL